MDGRRREEKESILLRDGRINKAAAPAIYNQRPLGYIRPQPNTEQSRSKFSLSYFAYEMMLCSLALYQVSGDYGWHESSCCCCSFTLDFGLYTTQQCFEIDPKSLKFSTSRAKNRNWNHLRNRHSKRSEIYLVRRFWIVFKHCVELLPKSKTLSWVKLPTLGSNIQWVWTMQHQWKVLYPSIYFQPEN